MPSLHITWATNPAVSHDIDLDDDANLTDLCDILFSLTDIPPHRLRLRARGRPLPPCTPATARLALASFGLFGRAVDLAYFDLEDGEPGNNKNSSSSSNNNAVSTPSSLSPSSTTALSTAPTVVTPALLDNALRRVVTPADPSAAAASAEFVGRVRGYYQKVLEYEDPVAQQRARDVIPLARLRAEAEAALSKPSVPGAHARAPRNSSAATSASGGGAEAGQQRQQQGEQEASAATPTACPDRELTRALLQWFKHSFFTWVNAPSCGACNSTATRILRVDAPAAHERHPGRAGRVEVYGCAACGAETRFPRYTDGVTLLSWRRGRCGEWAQAFTLCARAAGLRARVVHDWTDHVWTEVWSPALRRWLHADSCEDCLDEPLLYDQGWGKKLNFCVATGVDGVRDVTRRYTKDFAAVCERRAAAGVDEGTIAAGIVQLDQIALRKLPAPKERAAARKRAALDFHDLMDERDVVGQLRGRQSGSREWVRARGEDGAAW